MKHSSKSMVINQNNLINIIFALSLLSPLYYFQNRLVSATGFACAMSVLILCTFIFIGNIRSFYLDTSFMVLCIIFAFFCIQILYYRRMSAIYRMAQIIMFMVLAIVLDKSRLEMTRIYKWKHFIRWFYYFVMAMCFFIYLTGNVYSVNRAVLLSSMKILFPLSWFAIKWDTKSTWLELLIFIVFHHLLGERTAIVCMILLVMFRFILMKVHDRGSNILFWCVLIMAYALPFIYICIYRHPIGQVINRLTIELTGAQFFSGRNIIWGVILDGVQDNMLFGLGFGNTLFTDYSLNLSTHNLYMYLYLNGGIFLCVLFALFLYSIWKKIPHDGGNISSVSKAYILGLIVFCDMELFLIGNNIAISLMWWITMAFMQIISRNEKNSTEPKCSSIEQTKTHRR